MIDIDAALADLASATAEQPDQVPPEWQTMQQWAVKAGQSRCHVSRKIKTLIDAGEWEAKMFRIPNGRRGVFPVTHYRKKQRVNAGGQ